MLNWMMVRYTLKADRAAENERYIHAVFEQLRRAQPPEVHYTVLKLDDGVSFMHLVALDAAAAGNPVVELPAFKEFTAAIADRCVEPPVSIPLHAVEGYHMAGE